jgi:Protein of unknown function (DUF3723)
MIHSYIFETNDSDCEIFRQIILHKIRRDEKGKEAFLLRLTPSKRADVRQLLGHRLFKSIFDPIASIPGLFYGWELGQLRRLLNMHCDEVSKWSITSILHV